MSNTFAPGTPGVYDIAAAQSFIDSLPSETEQYNFQVLLLNLINLNTYVNDYASSVALHNHVGQLRSSVMKDMTPDTANYNSSLNMLQTWDEMAGREAALIVYHVGKTLLQIKATMRFVPLVLADADSEKLRKISGELERAFPNYNLARHAVSHRAEAMGSLEKIKQHAVDIEEGQQFTFGKIEGDDYIASFEKKLIRVQLTDTALQTLNAVVSAIYSAFPILLPMLPQLEFGNGTPDGNEA